MGSLNQWTGIGNLGADATARFLPDGTPVLNFSIACSKAWKTKDGQKKERTEWVRCSYWGKGAEAIGAYLTKGKSIAVVGELQTRKWTDKDQIERYTTEVRADRIVLLGSKDRSTERPAAEHVRDEAIGHGEPSIPIGDDEDSIPF